MNLFGLFKSLSPSRQAVVALLLTLVIAAALAGLYFTVLRQPYVPLFTGLRPNEAGPIVAELEKRKVPYKLEERGATILVPSEVVDRTRLGVAADDLPGKGAVGFELFNKSDMGLTEFAQRINYQRALQGELARTIMTMDGVDSARIHLSMPEPALFRDERKPAKASVTIAMRQGRALNPPTVAGVQRLVAAAVPDLAADDVVILDASGAVVSGPRGATGPAPASESAAPESQPAEAPAAEARRAIEVYYQAIARQALQEAPGGAQAQVSVAAEIPPTWSTPELARWTPGTRGFPLTVELLAAPEEPHARQALEQSLTRALSLNVRNGDRLTEVARPGTNAVAPAATESPQPVASRGGWSIWAWAVGLVLLIILAGAAVLGRRGELRPMTSQQRQRYAANLKRLLERSDDVSKAA